MATVTQESVVEDITSLLSVSDADERIRMIEELKGVLQRELMRTHFDVPKMSCPACGCAECIRYGKTKAGTPRWKCKGCGSVRCHIDTGSILANTKLDEGKWMDYAMCFVDGLTCDEVASRIGVCHKTAWFMRLRTMQAVFPNLPSFQVKAGNGVEIDEIYFRESFKGARFDDMENVPREPHEDVGGGKRGISDEQICVITGFNDTGDLFFDVCCRGPLTCDIAMSTLEDRICSGAIVNTDENRAYPRVMRELSVATHCHQLQGAQGPREDRRDPWRHPCILQPFQGCLDQMAPPLSRMVQVAQMLPQGPGDGRQADRQRQLPEHLEVPQEARFPVQGCLHEPPQVLRASGPSAHPCGMPHTFSTDPSDIGPYRHRNDPFQGLFYRRTTLLPVSVPSGTDIHNQN